VSRPRSLLHGTCLLGGQHSPGSLYAAECPVHKRAARSASRRKGWETRRIKDGPQGAAQAATGPAPGLEREAEGQTP
jgi:hypothetical protein